MKIDLKTRPNPGFTLVELLVVMAIVAILSGVGLNSLISAQQKGRDAKRKGDLKSVSRALEAFLNDYGHYPTDINGLIAGCGNSTKPTACNWGEAFKFNDRDHYYMTQLPKDPRPFQNYYYESGDGSYYILYARLENKKDKQVPKNPNKQPKVYLRTDSLINTNCGELTCNWALTSSNVVNLETTDE